jgi:hypothetical protein
VSLLLTIGVPITFLSAFFMKFSKRKRQLTKLEQSGTRVEFNGHVSSRYEVTVRLLI